MESPASAKKMFKWSAESERDLYGACLVALDEPKGPTLARALKVLRETTGFECTLKAAQHRVQHLQKLKRKDGLTHPATPTGDAGPSSGLKKSRGTGQGTAATKLGKPTSDDDDDEEETPSKKKPKTAAKRVKKAGTPVSDPIGDVKAEPTEQKVTIFKEDTDDDAI